MCNGLLPGPSSAKEPIMISRRLTLVVSSVMCLLGFTISVCAEAVRSEPVRIGLVSSLFTDIPQPLIEIVAAPFSSLMKELTGLDGKMAVSGNAFETARKLNGRDIDLAVFDGVEFGWA